MSLKLCVLGNGSVCFVSSTRWITVGYKRLINIKFLKPSIQVVSNPHRRATPNLMVIGDVCGLRMMLVATEEEKAINSSDLNVKRL